MYVLRAKYLNLNNGMISTNNNHFINQSIINKNNKRRLYEENCYNIHVSHINQWICACTRFIW